MSESNFQKVMLRELALFLEPLRYSAQSYEHALNFLSFSGWQLDPNATQSLESIANAVQGILNSIDNLIGVDDLSIESIGELIAILDDLDTAISGFSNLEAEIGAILSIDKSDLIGDVLNALMLIYISGKSLFTYNLLEMLTIIWQDEPEFIDDAGTLVHIRNANPRLNFSRLSSLIQDPVGTLESVYWPDGFPDQATVQLVAEKLFPRIVKLLAFIGDEPRILAGYGPGGRPVNLPADIESELRSMMSFWWKRFDASAGLETELGASIGLLPATEGGPGVFVVPFGSADFTTHIGNWVANFESAFDAEGFQITSSGIQLYSGAGEVPYLSVRLSPDVEGQSDLLIGSTTGTRFEVKDISFEADLTFSHPQYEISIFVRLHEAALVLDAGDSDGFLQKLLPPDGVRIDFDLAAGWSNQRGFHIEGSGSFETRLPLHAKIGPVEIPAVTIRMLFEDGEIPISLGLDVKAKLGPFTAVVENIGIKLDFTFPPDGGNLGPVNWKPGFKPPSGVGLSLKGGGFKGGGFLSFEPELHRYAGVLELEFKKGLALKAIGLLNTELPGGAPGFSLLLIISAEFSPIQLGMGFTLNGVGGLLGVNRAAKLDVLRNGIKTGALSTILFPTNIIENAPQIISDLRAIFPPEDGRYLFGPMVKMGWGTPTLVSVELGLIIGVPSPVQVAILGVVKIALPDDDNIIIKIQVSFMGTWEEDTRTITFFASLFDSRLLKMTLTGDMAFLMKYGGNSTFLVTAGGFHPSFVPPPLPLPSVARMAIILRDTKKLRILVYAYFAVTSNTAQFGCGVDFMAKQGKYSVSGGLGFDALFQFSPFAMTVSMHASFSVKRTKKNGKVKTLFSVSASVTLAGPAPWSAYGNASFKFLKIKIKFKFSKTWGEARNVTLPNVDVFPKLVAALQNRSNWETLAPASEQMAVTLRKMDDLAPGELVLRPNGILTVKQKVVPLNQTISKFGNQNPHNGNRFSISGLRIGGMETSTQSTDEEFAPAQFHNLSKAQKISRKSFELMPAGAKAHSANVDARVGMPVVKPVAYETKIIDTRLKMITLVGRFFEWASVFGQLISGGAVGISTVSFFKTQPVIFGAAQVSIQQEGFSIVKTEDLRLVSQTTQFASETEAHDHMAGLVKAKPELQGQYQIVPDYEARQAA